MEPQYYEWTCSVCALTWVLNAVSNSNLSRTEVGSVLGYPSCVNETYGCMSAQCLINALSAYGYESKQRWVTFEEAYAISRYATGLINPVGMYHYMAIRGVSDSNIWLANSAQGYKGVYETLSRSQFNAYSPVQIIYVEPYQ